MTDALDRIWTIFTEQLQVELAKAEKRGAQREHAAIVRYLDAKAPELGADGYRLAHDVDMGLHHNQEGQ